MGAGAHWWWAVFLVGAVGADDALGLPDFRAAERTFQLLTQMAGRAGRGENPGTVLLQAYQPDHYAIDAAIEHDYAAFYRREIEYRRRFAYPPFEALIACMCRGKSALAVKEEADRLAGALRDAAGDRVHVLNPTARTVFLLCDGTRTVDQIAEALVETYDVDRQVAERDARQLVERLVELGLLSLG